MCLCVELLAIRASRKGLNDRTRKTIGGRTFGAQILSEIAVTAATTVFKIHRALRSTERSQNTITSATATAAAAADLLDALHRGLRLFALCKVSGDVAKEVRLDDDRNRGTSRKRSRTQPQSGPYVIIILHRERY